MKTVFLQAGFCLLNAACESRNAIETYLRNRPSLVLVDLGTVNMDGLLALRTIRTIDPTARVIAYGAHSQRPFLSFAAQTGVISLMVESSDPRIVVEKIANLSA